MLIIYFSRRSQMKALAIAFLILGLHAPYLSAKEIKIAAGEWGDWSGPELINYGFVSQLITESFKLEGYDVVFEFYPWKRNYVVQLSGQVHGSAYWYPSIERKKLNYYSDPVTEERISFFQLASSPKVKWEKFTDLKDQVIGISRGHTYTDEFLNLCKAKELRCESSDNDKTNMRKLLAGRIQLFPISETVGYDFLKKMKKDRSIIRKLEKPLSVATGHLLFLKKRKDSQKLLSAFNRGLRTLKKNGTYQTYLKNLWAGKYRKINRSKKRSGSENEN